MRFASLVDNIDETNEDHEDHEVSHMVYTLWKEDIEEREV